MIRQETIYNEAGTAFRKTYSDAGFLIEQELTGARYGEAIDPLDSVRAYRETGEPMETPEEGPEEGAPHEP